MQVQMKVMRNEKNRWEIAYRIGDSGDFAFEADNVDFPTRQQALDELKWSQIQSSNEAFSERRYASQIAYACGERD